MRKLCPYFLCACLLLTACNPLVNFFAFHPDDSYIQPSEALPPGTEEIFFEAEDGVRIQALHLRNPSSDIITIFFHGNAGNIYRRLNDYRLLRRLGTGVFAVSYRGYAKSEGSPSEAGIYRDGKAAFDHVTKVMGYPPSRIFIFGRSIGSTVATDLAQDKDIAGLILVSPLSSARDQASVMRRPTVGKLDNQRQWVDRMLIDKIEQFPIDVPKPYANNPRKHSKRQQRKLENSLLAFGFVMPILLDDDDTVIAGEALLEAAMRLGYTEVPAIRVSHLSPDAVKALRIALNKIADLGDWDEAKLADELKFLVEVDFDVDLTGFEMAEVDFVIDSQFAPVAQTPTDIRRCRRG